MLGEHMWIWPCRWDRRRNVWSVETNRPRCKVSPTLFGIQASLDVIWSRPLGTEATLLTETLDFYGLYTPQVLGSSWSKVLRIYILDLDAHNIRAVEFECLSPLVDLTIHELRGSFKWSMGEGMKMKMEKYKQRNCSELRRTVPSRKGNRRH